MRDSEISAMIEALRTIKAERHFSQSGLAHLLGFSPGHLSMIFGGQRKPGLRFVRAVLERFPEIRKIVVESLQRPTGKATVPLGKPALGRSEPEARR